MKKTFSHFIVFSVLIILVSSCQDKIEVGEITQFEILDLDGNKVNCKAEMEINNLSYFPCKIETGEIHAFSNGSDIGLVKLKKPIKIIGNAKNTYQMEFYLEIKNPEAGIFALLGNLFGKKSAYRLKGNIIARTFIFYRTIEFDREVSSN